MNKMDNMLIKLNEVITIMEEVTESLTGVHGHDAIKAIAKVRHSAEDMIKENPDMDYVEIYIEPKDLRTIEKIGIYLKDDIKRAYLRSDKLDFTFQIN